MKIGLFFGTFNPVHFGHVEIVCRLLNDNIFNQIWIILTPRSPHKNSNLARKEHRLQMLNTAFKDYKKVIISDVEFNLKEPNYTINTLTYLHAKFPKYNFSIIMGSDNFLKIETWKNSGKIIDDYNIYVYPREGFRVTNNMHDKNVNYLNFPKIKISSTIIRDEIICKGKEIEQYLPSSVYEYIKIHHLY